MRLFPRRSAPSNNETDDNDSSNFLQQASELIPAEVRMISGCHSEQTSADLSNVSSVANSLPNPAGRSGGACTSALLDVLYAAHKRQKYSQTKPLTFQDLLLELRSSLSKSGFEQVPQLTSSRPLDVSESPFHLVGGTGKRRALLVGINYIGQNGQLSGCFNDVYNVKKYLQDVHGFPPQDITVLVDDGKHIYPTRHRIIEELKRLVNSSIGGDSVFFHYSGHGGLLDPDGFNVFKAANPNAKEYDETLYPVDHDTSGQIRDFSLFNNFVKPMKEGVFVTCLMDCCHSGSVLDLPYSFQPTSGGGIRMQRSLDSLSNLAFLYILAGGLLPMHGFENVTHHIENNVDGDLDDYQGTGIENSEMDDVPCENPQYETPEDYDDRAVEDADYGGDYDDFDDGGVDEGFGGGENAVDGPFDGPADFDGPPSDGNVADGPFGGPTDFDGPPVPPPPDGGPVGFGEPPGGDIADGMPGGPMGFDESPAPPPIDTVQGVVINDDDGMEEADRGAFGDYFSGGESNFQAQDDGGDDGDAGLDCGCLGDVFDSLLEDGE